LFIPNIPIKLSPIPSVNTPIGAAKDKKAKNLVTFKEPITEGNDVLYIIFEN
jgi:hypothetical protein